MKDLFESILEKDRVLKDSKTATRKYKEDLRLAIFGFIPLADEETLYKLISRLVSIGATAKKTYMAFIYFSKLDSTVEYKHMAWYRNLHIPIDEFLAVHQHLPLNYTLKDMAMYWERLHPQPIDDDCEALRQEIKRLKDFIRDNI